MAGVGVVTDSTASLDPRAADRAGVRIVPLQVVIDGLSQPEDGDGRSAAAVADALQSGASVSTSRPSPEAFARVFDEAARAGAEAIVSVHLSGRISGTVDAARLAAAGAEVPVTVVDTGCAAMAVGYSALAAAAVAAGGADATVVAAAARDIAARSATWFCVHSLEHLRRGGRIGTAQALLGTALAVKPLLTVEAGVITPYERVRTVARATGRLAELALTAAARLADPAGGVEVTVHHVADPAGARQLAQRIESGAGFDVRIAELSAVLAVHVGPGTLGVVVAPLSPGADRV